MSSKRGEPSLMLIYGEFGTIALIFKCFGLLINGGSVASVSYAFRDSAFHSGWMEFAWDGCSMFGCLCWGSSNAFGPAFLGLHVWELCFSLVSLLWESCYSLAFG